MGVGESRRPRAAGAGTIWAGRPGRRSTGDQRRGCGEHDDVGGLRGDPAGPTPRVRGARHTDRRHLHADGTNPAGAGSTGDDLVLYAVECSLLLTSKKSGKGCITGLRCIVCLGQGTARPPGHRRQQRGPAARQPARRARPAVRRPCQAPGPRRAVHPPHPSRGRRSRRGRNARPVQLPVTRPGRAVPGRPPGPALQPSRRPSVPAHPDQQPLAADDVHRPQRTSQSPSGGASAPPGRAAGHTTGVK